MAYVGMYMYMYMYCRVTAQLDRKKYFSPHYFSPTQNMDFFSSLAAVASVLLVLIMTIVTRPFDKCQPANILDRSTGPRTRSILSCILLPREKKGEERCSACHMYLT